LVSDEAPCANTGPANMAEMASAIAEVFTSFIQFSWFDWRCAVSRSMRHSSGTAHRIDQSVANGARTMQAAPCGHRLGISGPFRENLATD
jgi:hypothetical protein